GTSRAARARVAGRTSCRRQWPPLRRCTGILSMCAKSPWALICRERRSDMEPIQEIRGTAVPLWLSDVDTDQLLPKQFLTKLERTGYGEHLLHDWRTDGSSVLDDPRYSGASILVAGRNFGCGSS